MGTNSAIEWCHHSFNPWWGCFKVSDGCKNCYAETLSKRFGHAIWGPSATTTRRTFGSKHWEEPLAWNAVAEREGVRKRVFCASMADVFESNERLIYERKHLWQVIRRTPHLDWLLLTKRPENICLMVPTDWLDTPPDNVWYGTSVENQNVEIRIYELACVPARVRFLSCEPLLGPLNLQYWLDSGAIHWVIAGAESGHGARSMDMAWVRSLRDQCTAAGVAFFFKQGAIGGKKVPLPMLDGRQWMEFPEVTP